MKAGQSFPGETAPLDHGATTMVGRIGPVEAVSATGSVAASVYRTDFVHEVHLEAAALPLRLTSPSG